jgi:hypothetical protein
MAIPTEVQDLTIKDTYEFDRRGNSIPIRMYTFYVEDHGPFYEKFYSGEQYADAVEKRLNDLVLSLRAQGVLKTK